MMFASTIIDPTVATAIAMDISISSQVVEVLIGISAIAITAGQLDKIG